jgi:16S rRNA (cytidine1402-2'-O)-methyltransferase
MTAEAASPPPAPATLYLVPATLGDTAWESYLPREAREIVCGLDCFIVENSKSARAELKRLGYPRPLQTAEMRVLPPPDAAPDERTLDALLDPLLHGRPAGLLSEAGCPGVADPGAMLVRRAHARGIRVRPLVGPSSLLLGLMASGLEGQRFAFHGYLPVAEIERRKAIQDLEAESQRRRQTQIFIETPYRNAALFHSLLQHCRPHTLLCVATHLTLPDEAVATRDIAHWRRSAAPDFARRPTVFLLLAP